MRKCHSMLNLVLKGFDSTKPFFIIVEGPEEAVIGEQIGLRVSIMNYQFIEIKAEIILLASDDYRFVEVEPFGIVSSYNPRTTDGEHQHLIYVKPVSHMIVHVPIVATKIGDIEVNIVGRTQVARDIASVTISIAPDGVPVHRHTSLLLDMRNEAYIMRYLDVNVTEDPIIPYEETYRHYIFGSPKASVTIIGDVVGAPFPSDPKSPIGLKALNMAAPVKSGEHIMFDFTYSLYTLHYLRLTNQLRTDTMRGMLDYLNKAYVYQSVFYKNGAYTMFKGEKPSLCVTVNGDRYRARITNFFIPELNNHDVQELWFQQDGATCHTARATIDLLKHTLGDRLISRFGPVNWPPRSCDLTPLDYFLWGYVKSLVYADKPQTLDHLEDNIRRVIADIRPQMLEKVIENWTSRLDYIRACRGSPMPKIIFKINATRLSF
ncbi:macroglobulin complement-related [Trichonephila clavipes]|nr:macroglobulin complement-related [Trichonephila clavipes]